MPAKNLTPEEYYRLHQQAFRCAFDWLNSHFPPMDDAEWWEKAAQDLTDADVAVGGNALARELLLGVYTYLENERRRRLNENGA